MENNEKKEVVVMCVNNGQKYTIKDYVSLGFGFYIGWNIARTLKYTLLGIRIKKD